MKPKIFRDAAWPAFFVIEIFCMLLLAFILFFSVYILLLEKENLLQGIIPTHLIIFELLWGGGGGGFVFVCFVNSPRILDRAFGRLLIYDGRVVLKCPFRKTRVMTVDDCLYVGVEDYTALNRGIPVVRGDEVSFIYFSVTPYPKEYRGKISSLKNRKGFIKFSYTDELAIALFNILSNEQSYLLKTFYNKMQAQDRKLKNKKKK